MSTPHDLSSAPERPEVSNPIIWTIGMLAIIGLLGWWFAHWMHAGQVEGRKHGPIPLPQKGGGEPDHLALIAKVDQNVLDDGAALYGKNCAACHGPNGDSNPTNINPPPRNFHKDAWKNPKGGGPYGLYLTLTNGYGGGMPGFPALSPEQRYAIAHYVRETMVKTNNKANYVADSDAVKKEIPPPGGGGDSAPVAISEEPEVAREPVKITAPVLPLMAGLAQQETADRSALSAWLIKAGANASADNQQSIRHLTELVDRTPALVVALRQSVRQNQRDRFTTLLADSDGSGAVRPYFALLSANSLGALFDHLRSQEVQ